MKVFSIKLPALILSVFGLAAVSQAQQYDNPVAIPISFYAFGVTHGTSCSFAFGQGLSATAYGSGAGYGTFIYSPATIAMVVPGVTYNVTVTSTNCTAVIGLLQPIDGCDFFVNGMKSQYVSMGTNYQFTLRVDTINDLAKSLSGSRGGQCSSFTGDKAIWYLGLGSTRNGQFAGGLGFRSASIPPVGSSSLYNSSLLVCGNMDPTEISITRGSNGYITQVESRDVVVNVGAYVANSTSYQIQVCQVSTPTTPFITYTISQYPVGGTGIRIDKLEDGVNWSTVLLQNGSSTWTLYDWQLMAPGATTFGNPITTTISGSTETVTYGSGAGATTKTKTFVSVNGRTELASSAMGVGSVSTPPTTTYSYYSSSTGSGWSGALESITQPSGNWVAYDYYNGSTDARAGEVWHIYRPWINAPANVSTMTINGRVDTYNYTTNYDGTQTAPSSDVVSINNTTAGQTTWAYNWAYSAVNGHTIAQVVEQDYSSSSAYLTKTTLMYPQSDSISFFWGKPHSVKRPDNTKDSYAYYSGTWNPTTYTFVPGTGGTNNDYLTLAFHGQVGTGTTSWTVGSTTWTLDPIALVAGLSTVTETVVDTHGRQVFKAENIYTGSGIQRISGTANTYNGNNLLVTETDIMRSVPNGLVAVTHTYQAGLAQSMVDFSGLEMDYAYNSFLKLQKVTTAPKGSGNFPSTAQSFTYYSSGLKWTGQENPRDPTTTTYTYDAAGRVLSSSVPGPNGPLNTGYSYPTPLQTTVTLPTGATKITYLNLDGRASETGGTGQVDTRYGWSNDSNYIYSATQLGSDKSNGWSEVASDWLGRPITKRSSEEGWSTGASTKIVRKTYSYSSTTGQLTSVSTTDESNNMARLLPDHLYVYGNLGMLVEEGDNLGNNGSLTPMSTDRITQYSTIYTKEATGYDGWIRQDCTYVYNTPNSLTLTTTSQKNTRLTQFNGGALYSGNSCVISDVTSIDASGRTTRDLEWVYLAARSRTHQQSIQGVTQAATTYWQDGYLEATSTLSGVSKLYAYNGAGQLYAGTEGTTNAEITYAYYPNTNFQSSVTQTTGASTTAVTSYSYAWDTTRHTTIVAATDSANNVAYSESNALGLPWHTWGTAVQPSETDYDAYGRRTGMTTWQSGGSTWTGSTWPSSPPTGNAVTWALDPASGLALTKTFPDGSQVKYTYNARGQPLVRTWARGVTATYSYFDTAGSQTGELQQVVYSDGTPTVTYTYTRWGALATVGDGSGSRTYNYRVSGTTDDLKLSTETLDSSFYNGRVLTTTYDASVPGRTTGYSFNGGLTVALTSAYDGTTGRVSSVTGQWNTTNTQFNLSCSPGTDWVSTVTDGSGLYNRSLPLMTSYDTPASATTTWNGTTMGSFTANYTDLRGWRNGQIDNSSAYMTALGLGSLTNAYGFDGFGQLTTVNSAVNWTYDLAGNRLTDMSNGGSTTYTPGSLNQYSAITGTLGENSLSYDADGNLKQDGTWTYSYDGENRLISMVSSAQTLTFKYDFLGRRIRKTVTGTNASDTKFVWAGWQLVADLNADGYDVIRSYVWGPDFSDGRAKAGGAGSLLAIYNTGPKLTYAVPDALGNIVGYINTSGSVVAAVQYAPFGRVISSAGGSLGSYPIGYSGQYTDWETGLVYYGQRYYSPKHGRFVNRDPIEEAGGMNLYAFCLNNPINRWDILGNDDNTVDNNTDLFAPDISDGTDLDAEINQLLGFQANATFDFGSSSSPAPTASMQSSDPNAQGSAGQSANGSAPSAPVPGNSAQVPDSTLQVAGTTSATPNSGGYWQSVGQVLQGEGSAVVGLAQGIGNSLLDPIGTLTGVGNALLNPAQSGQAIVNGLTNTWNNLTGTDPYAAGNAVGNILIVGASVVAPYASSAAVPGAVGAAETTTGFRAVSTTEYQSIADTEAFGPSPMGSEVKYFSNSQGQAVSFGERMYGPGNYGVVQGEFPASAIGDTINPATEGPGFVVPNGNLPAGTPTLLIPPHP
jgi:RHS repeat-associated protein